MNIRVTKHRHKDQTYQYVQIVENYRREDGRPTCRVIAHLGRLPEEMIANLRVAFEASREGQLVVMARDASATRRRPPEANLEYLDIAVLLELWRQMGCKSLLARSEEHTSELQSH